MPGELILHPYAPGIYPERQQRCWEALAELEHTSRYQVEHHRVIGDYDYARLLELNWYGPETLVIIEHDIAPTKRHLDRLLACSHPICAWQYTVPCDHERHGYRESAHRVIDANGEHCYTTGEEWAERVGLGLVKIAPELRQTITARPAGPRVAWHDLAYAISERINGHWHVHETPVLAHGH